MDKVVVFDLDDTLYKEIDYLRSAYWEIALWIESFFGKKDIFLFMLECYNQGKDVFGSLNLCYGLDIPIDIYLYKYRTHIPVSYTHLDVYKRQILSTPWGSLNL